MIFFDWLIMFLKQTYLILRHRLSEKSFVLFFQYPPDEGLFRLDQRQFQRPKNGSLGLNQSEVPWISLGDRLVKLSASTIFMLVLGVICAVGLDSRDPMVSCLTFRSFMKRLLICYSHCFFQFYLFENIYHVTGFVLLSI